MAEPWLEETRPCIDQECPGTMEPEEDGSLRYFSCTTCGYGPVGWEFIPENDGCQLGVPASIRARAQAPDEGGPVFVSIGRRPPQ